MVTDLYVYKNMSAWAVRRAHEEQPIRTFIVEEEVLEYARTLTRIYGTKLYILRNGDWARDFH